MSERVYPSDLIMELLAWPQPGALFYQSMLWDYIKYSPTFDEEFQAWRCIAPLEGTYMMRYATEADAKAQCDDFNNKRHVELDEMRRERQWRDKPHVPPRPIPMIDRDIRDSERSLRRLLNERAEFVDAEEKATQPTEQSVLALEGE